MLDNCLIFKWCHQESNRGHKDFQSFALPTELWHHCFLFAVAKVGIFFESTNFLQIFYQILFGFKKMIYLCTRKTETECSAVGSALRSGRRGRAFESPHSDRRRQAMKIVCRLFFFYLCRFLFRFKSKSVLASYFEKIPILQCKNANSFKAL